MTNEQQRKMLEAAAKACGIKHRGYCDAPSGLILFEDADALKLWNPLTNPADTAEMCTDVGIGTEWWELDNAVNCWLFGFSCGI